MGTKVQYKSSLPGHYSMRDLNEDFNSCSMPLYYGEKKLTNGQFQNGILPRATADAYVGGDKDTLKRTMLEHEAIFKYQVYELHRLYRIQRDMMDEAKRSETHRNQFPLEPSFSSSRITSQMTSEEARKWNFPHFPVEEIHSSSNSMKGNDPQPGLFPFQNRGNSKDFEVLESTRPTKVRRKTFDLQLPAYEYIDSEDGEQVHEEKASSRLAYLANGCKKIEPVSGSRSGSCFRNINSLTDLNEPFQLEETNVSSSVKTQSPEPSTNQKLQLLGWQREISQSYGSESAAPINLFLENMNGRGVIPPAFEAGNSKSNQKSISQGLQTEKLLSSSQSMRVFLNEVHKPQPVCLANKGKVGSVYDSWLNGRSHEISSSKYPGDFLSSKISVSGQTQLCSNSAATLLTSSHLSSWTNGLLGDSWNFGDENRTKEGFGIEIPYRNRLHVGSSTSQERKQKNGETRAMLPWLRDIPSTKTETTISERVTNNSETVNGCDQNFNQNNKPSNRLLGFPIFEETNLSKNESFSLTSPNVSLPHPSEVESKGNRIARVVDINLPCDPLIPESDKQVATDVPVTENGRHTKFRCQIDLNTSISDDETSLRPSVLAEFDLEAPAVPETDEDYDPVEADTEQNHDELVIVAAEAILAISSSPCHRNLVDSTCSSSSEDFLSDPLNWFADIVFSCGDDHENRYKSALRSKDDLISEGFDYFESMTLRLTDTKEEDYMPKHLVPDNINLEETGTGTALLQNHPRRGQARRGRQRRDFQRDILPGLTSLSRHEVTEDLQTFGGIMRATGHSSWQSGLARRNSTRNGGGRGRRRKVVSPSPPPPTSPGCTLLVQQLSNIDMGLEDRSLTGWGKTTRRPRRQRCPGGAPGGVALI